MDSKDAHAPNYNAAVLLLLIAFTATAAAADDVIEANIKPNGIDFKSSGGKPTDRYTNGRTIGDIVGEELVQQHYAVPFLDPNTTGEVILYGVNYASGGGGIMNATGRIFVSLDSEQMAYVTITDWRNGGALPLVEGADSLVSVSGDAYLKVFVSTGE
ncbi:hypothetical protein L1987_34334 [Smallanthus sonchifolius]|uniref:Uncharacterized protein n=1 Tax=Smallanthus sonchifolius TaxID=185202 RepID=A0ACB9HV07_9ASTR|nr:hypothetical protein L1987_34334 [Smallanthus sonchifolius]